VASRLAARLGWHLLDSGLLYRLVALRALREGLTSEQEKALESVAERLDSEFRFEDGVTRIFLDGKEVTRDLRVEAVSAMASRVAAVPAVRAALAQRQRDFRRPPGLVADGRDMGTVIFPEAPLKIYLTASVQARAERRYKQLKEKGESVNLSRLFRDLEERDARDSTRAVAPLRPAPGALTVDSTGLSVEQVLDRIMSAVKEKSLTN
jgi:cytidylate kinase